MARVTARAIARSEADPGVHRRGVAARSRAGRGPSCDPHLSDRPKRTGDRSRDGPRLDETVVDNVRSKLDASRAHVAFEVDAAVEQTVKLTKWLAYHYGPEDAADLADRAALTLRGARAHGHAGALSDHQREVRAFWERSELAVSGEWAAQQARRAREVGCAGALFPWRTINGEEASAYYAAGTAQYHIDADIAYALDQYVRVTGDTDLLFRHGVELLVETARMWAELGFFCESRGGRFVINKVTGPDEYTTVVDNNLFTNLMAAENLRIAADSVDRVRAESPADFGRPVDRIGFRDEEVVAWRRAADEIYIPYDDEAGVHLQDESFLDYEQWDFAGTPADRYPLLLHTTPW
jgi:trehalose/maltose hydrolase-like predicted phosphorylase